MSSVWKLFFVFLKIGLLSIGGGYAVIPLIQEQVVESQQACRRTMIPVYYRKHNGTGS